MKRTAKIPHFILASASPRRRQLLKEAGLRFTIVPSNVSERAPSGLSHAALVRYLALKKAKWVAKNHPTRVVLGADTLVFLEGRAIGKPKNPRHAERILRQLSGRWQRVYTGVAAVWAGGKKAKVGVALSWVKFKRLTDEQIRRVSSQHLDKAGAYSVQDKNDLFVERIKGGYDNVVGLPVSLSRRLLSGAFQAFPKLVRR
jgi:septum formation protein